MDVVHILKEEKHNPWLDQRRSPRDLWIQIAISVALGASAFLAFCVCSVIFYSSSMADLIQILRPRWSELYAARKRQKDAAAQLPELPGSLFGWMPVLYRITSEEMLASAGLDAYAVSVLLVKGRQRLTCYSSSASSPLLRSFSPLLSSLRWWSSIQSIGTSWIVTDLEGIHTAMKHIRTAIKRIINPTIRVKAVRLDTLGL